MLGLYSVYDDVGTQSFCGLCSRWPKNIFPLRPLFFDPVIPIIGRKNEKRNDLAIYPGGIPPDVVLNTDTSICLCEMSFICPNAQ